MAVFAADTEAAAGGGRVVEKGFAALLCGDGGGLQPHALRLLSHAWTAATRRPAGEILRWAATQPRRTRALSAVCFRNRRAIHRG